MPCRPASRMIMWNPKYFHVMITNMVSITIAGSASQPWTNAPSPAPSSDRSARPSGSRISWKTMPVITSEMTYGAKKISRSRLLPRNRRFSVRARNRANGIWMLSDRTMMRTTTAMTRARTAMRRVSMRSLLASG